MAHTLTYNQHFAVPLSHEHRGYLTLKLTNGVHGIVITDPSEDLVSCALSVATGHHANPDDVPGLAHLCEHMISVSSRDFPTPDTLGRAIYNSGGTKNAMTTNESSTFFFSLPITVSNKTQSDFEHILDVFTSNFDHPLFDQAYSNREIYAVDNEHTINKSKKTRLAFQGFKLLANQNHQFSRFSTGNFASLTASCKNYDIRSKLVEFFKKEYTPDKMCFVLRGPQSLNYLQKLAIMNFSKIGNFQNFKNMVSNPLTSTDIFKPKISSEIFNPNVSSKIWSHRYQNQPYGKEQLQKAVLINKDVDSIMRISFPINLKQQEMFSKKDLLFFQDYWCDLFGSESVNTIASALYAKEYIVAITTKTSVVTFEVSLLELELVLSEKGIRHISTILNIVFSYSSLFDVKDGSKFNKHLAKSMSQFNGIQMYNFLYAEAESDFTWEVKSLSSFMLTDTSPYNQFVNKQLPIFDFSNHGYKGSYSESQAAKEWWAKKAAQFCQYIKRNISIDNVMVSYVGHLEKTCLHWILNLPQTYKKETDFDFEFKIGQIDCASLGTNNPKKYSLDLSPPNIFANEIVDNQTQLLAAIAATKSFSSTAALGYSVKNISLSETPTLVSFDSGSQLWYKQEVDSMYKNKALFTMELVNTKVQSSPDFVAALEVLIQLVQFRVNEYLYPALTMNYTYNLYPSFKGDTGILLHVSGPCHNFVKVFTILIYEIKLLVGSFKTATTKREFEKAKKAVMFRFENVSNIPSMETANLGMMALIEENTWMSDQRINALESCTFERLELVLPELFSKCYLTTFLHGDISSDYYKNELLPVVDQLAPNLEGKNHQFPSSILLPPGYNYFAKSSTKSSTNALQYFIQISLRNDVKNRSITKLVSFIMAMSLTNKLRNEYQLGYIALVGLKTFRSSQGIHISLVTGAHSAYELEAKVDDILVEWYEQSIKKLKQSQLAELIEKFISSEKASSKSSSPFSTSASLFYGAIGSTASNKKVIKQHCGFWEQIDTKNYAFSNSIHGEDFVDFDVIKSLTVDMLNDFISNKILPTSSERSKISVMIDSICPKEEIEKESRGIQLYLFLSSIGLPIKQEHLQNILRESGNSQIALGKKLYKYYREKGKSITIIAAMMAKLSKNMLFSNETSRIEPAVDIREINIKYIAEWQNQIAFIRDGHTMCQKLSKFIE